MHDLRLAIHELRVDVMRHTTEQARPSAADQLLGGARAGAPAPVGVGGVDEVAARLEVGVEHREGPLLVERPPETRCRLGTAGNTSMSVVAEAYELRPA